MLGAQASGTKVKPRWLTISSNGDRVNIRQPFPIGAAFGMAHIMTKLG